MTALSMTGIFVRWADAPGTVTAAYRMGIAAIVLTPLALREKGGLLLKSKLGWLWLLLAGVFIALDHGTLNTAVNLTRIANCTLLNNLSPLWVALFAVIIWRERLNRWFWLGLALALGGAGVILGNDFLQHPQLGSGRRAGFCIQYVLCGVFPGYPGRQALRVTVEILMDDLCDQFHSFVQLQFFESHSRDRVSLANLPRIHCHRCLLPGYRVYQHRLCPGAFTCIHRFPHHGGANRVHIPAGDTPYWRKFVVNPNFGRGNRDWRYYPGQSQPVPQN